MRRPSSDKLTSNLLGKGEILWGDTHILHENCFYEWEFYGKVYKSSVGNPSDLLVLSYIRIYALELFY